jgi:hypothetical protein
MKSNKNAGTENPSGVVNWLRSGLLTASFAASFVLAALGASCRVFAATAVAGGGSRFGAGTVLAATLATGVKQQADGAKRAEHQRFHFCPFDFVVGLLRQQLTRSGW